MATKELEYIKQPVPKLQDTLAALKRNDIPGARDAFDAYDGSWNGIEVYISTRSRDNYTKLEMELQHQVNDLLAGGAPKAAEISPLIEQMIAKYDEAIKLAETGPGISPLFDDVAAIRVVRADLRIVASALKAGNTGKAKTAFSSFQKGWPTVEGLIKSRNAGTHGEIVSAITTADKAFQGSNTEQQASSNSALMEKYNAGLALVVTEARGGERPSCRVFARSQRGAAVPHAPFHPASPGQVRAPILHAW